MKPKFMSCILGVISNAFRSMLMGKESLDFLHHSYIRSRVDFLFYLRTVLWVVT